MAAASAAFALLVGSTGTAFRRARGLPVQVGELTRDWTLRAGRRVQLRRVARYAIGVLLATGLLALQPSALWVVVLIVACTFGAELLVGRNYGIAMICITPLALLAVHLATPTPVGVLLVDRLVESIVGALVGIVVGFATRRWGARLA